MPACPSWSTSPGPQDWSVSGTRVPSILPNTSSFEFRLPPHFVYARTAWVFLTPTRSPAMPRNIQMGRISLNKKTRHSDPFVTLGQSRVLEMRTDFTNFAVHATSGMSSPNLLGEVATCWKDVIHAKNQHDNAIYTNNTFAALVWTKSEGSNNKGIG